MAVGADQLLLLGAPKPHRAHTDFIAALPPATRTTSPHICATRRPPVTCQWLVLSDPRAEHAAPPPQIGGLIGSYGCVAPLAYLGRKKTLLWANLFVFLSSALMFFGEVWWVLLLGRVSIGIVAGVAQMVAGSYMTEIAPIAIRGSVGVCSQVGIVCGIAFANFLTAPALARGSLGE